MHELFAMHSIAALLTLTALEVVLGIDNIVFIAILTNQLPEHQRSRARRLGLVLAALGRIVLLLVISWIITLDKTVLVEVLGQTITVKDLVLIAGGVFLVGKATWEIHHSLEAPHGETHDSGKRGVSAFGAVVAQILMIDVVFSIDSVLTAVGMVSPEKYTSPALFGTGVPWPPLVVMITAILIAIGAMLIYAGPIARFIERHPTFKMLALSFLLLVGVVLVAEGLHQHIPRGYIYSAMGFSLFVEMLNLKIKMRRRAAAGARG